MHASIFEYNISRPYPFRWFTPVVVLFGLVAIVLFSFLNFVTSSYTLVARYTSDPNATVAATQLRWPSLLAARLQPTCQSTNIPIGTRLLTNNSALTYTLTNVLQNANEDGETLSPALVYQANVLSDCNVTAVSLQVSSLARTAAQIALSGWGVSSQAFITCRLDTENQRTAIFNLTADYDFMPATVSIYSGLYYFVGRNRTSKTSLYWGESLLSMYWLKLARDMANARLVDRDLRGSSGTLVYNANGSTPNISSRAFFDVQWRFIVPLTNNNVAVQVFIGDAAPQIFSANGTFDIATSADTLAKSMYSTVLTDLGQHGPDANILADSNLLEHFTSRFSAIRVEDNRGGPASSAYVPDQDGPLVVTPSVFQAIYLCQIPQRKSTGSMLLTIIVADLVFLRALWALWKLAVDTYMKKVDTKASSCEGCRGNEDFRALLVRDDRSQSGFGLFSKEDPVSEYEVMPR